MLVPSNSFFKPYHAWEIVKNMDKLANAMPLPLILGIQVVSGSHNRLLACLGHWKTSDIWVQHLDDIEDAQIEQD